MIIQLLHLNENNWYKKGAVYINTDHISAMQEIEYRHFDKKGVMKVWDIRLVDGSQVLISIEDFLEHDLMNTAGK